MHKIPSLELLYVTQEGVKRALSDVVSFIATFKTGVLYA